MKKQVLGIKIDDVNIEQAVDLICGWLSRRELIAQKGDKHYIVTPNPEIVVMAQKDPELKKIINNADLAIPDGKGLKIATDIVCNTPGIDLMERLIKEASEKGFTVGLLGGKGGVAVKAKERLLLKYPNLRVSFAESGGEVDNQGESLGVLSARSPIRSPYFVAGTQWGPPLAATPRDFPSTDLLFVAFGPPKQEKWIANNLAKIPVKVAMGVGGAFDYISGQIKRAPKWIRDLGFEWLFRLIIQPWRIKRQLVLVKFIFYTLRTK